MTVFEAGRAPAYAREVTHLDLVLRRFVRHRVAVVGLIMLGAMVLAVVLAPWIAPYHPEYIDRTIVGEHAATGYAPPSRQHVLGTDELNRDVLSRLLHAGRISMLIGFASMMLAVGIGTAVGCVAGFYGGNLDSLLMRFVDLALTLPYIPLLLIVSAMLRQYRIEWLRPEQTQVLTIISVLVLLGWMQSARLVRGAVLSLKTQEFVEAGRALGTSDFRLMTRHLIPNALPPVIVEGTLAVGQCIIAESAISFLGVGINPPTASWGNMLTNFQTYMLVSPLMAVYPGACIFLTVLSINFVGDGLRDALDPRMVA